MDAAPPAAETTHAAETEALRLRILDKLTYQVGKSPDVAGDRDWFVATALAVRDTVVDRWFASTRRTYESGSKRVYYLSLEFLIGRLLRDGSVTVDGRTVGVDEVTEERRGQAFAFVMDTRRCPAAAPSRGLTRGCWRLAAVQAERAGRLRPVMASTRCWEREQ